MAICHLLAKLIQTYSGHDSTISILAFSPRGQLVLTGSEDNTVRIWELGGKELQKLEYNSKNISAAFSPDGQWVLTGSKDQTARLWQIFYEAWNQGLIYRLSPKDKAAYGIDWEY